MPQPLGLKPELAADGCTCGSAAGIGSGWGSCTVGGGEGTVQKIAIVGEELLEARARHIGELDFGLLGGPRGHARLDDVLLAGPGRLDHLVMGAAALVDKTVAEIDRGVVNDLRLLVGEQPLIAAVPRDEVFAQAGPFQGKGHKGLQGRRARTCSSLLSLQSFGSFAFRHRR